MRFSVK